MNAQYDGLGYLPADVLGVLNMAVEALAARQPVGEPVGGAVLIDGTVHLVQRGEEIDWVRDRGANFLYAIDRSMRNG